MSFSSTLEDQAPCLMSPSLREELKFACVSGSVSRAQTNEGGTGAAARLDTQDSKLSDGKEKGVSGGVGRGALDRQDDHLCTWPTRVPNNIVP